jgi:peptide-methionine (R)-S-oxide reductase
MIKKLCGPDYTRFRKILIIFMPDTLSNQEVMMSNSVSDPKAKLSKSPEEWRQILPPEQYAVLFEEGTERPFSHPLNNEKGEGTFLCAACRLPLFTSTGKYDSGSGWPSFYEAIEGNVEKKKDFKLIMPRVEYHCRRCGAHQGHVFTDGPQPTGERFCNNGLSLEFIPEGKELPDLRK